MKRVENPAPILLLGTAVIGAATAALLWTFKKEENPRPRPKPSTGWAKDYQGRHVPRQQNLSYPESQPSITDLGYENTIEGIFKLQQDFNLVNAILDENFKPILEDGLLGDETEKAVQWALAYQKQTKKRWLDIVESHA